MRDKKKDSDKNAENGREMEIKMYRYKREGDRDRGSPVRTTTRRAVQIGRRPYEAVQTDWLLMFSCLYVMFMWWYFEGTQ